MSFRISPTNSWVKDKGTLCMCQVCVIHNVCIRVAEMDIFEISDMMDPGQWLVSLASVLGELSKQIEGQMQTLIKI